MKKRQKIRSGLILVSFFLFPAVFYYLSPVLIVQASAEGIVNGSFIVFFLLFLSAFLFGRAYCGWVCPAAGCQEALFAARGRKVRRGNYLKWFIWLPWLAVTAALAVRSGGYRQVDFFYQTKFGLSITDVPSSVIYFLVLFLLIVLPSLVFGKRSFCHHLCWMAPFMIAGQKAGNVIKVPSLRLAAAAERCHHCHTCSDNCPMSLPVESMVCNSQLENSECILCGSCVDGCEQGVLRYSYY